MGKNIIDQNLFKLIHYNDCMKYIFDKDLVMEVNSKQDIPKKVGSKFLMDVHGNGCGWCVKDVPNVQNVCKDLKNNNVQCLGLDIHTKNGKKAMKEIGMNVRGTPAKFLCEVIEVNNEKQLDCSMHRGYSSEKELRDKVKAKGFL